MASEMFIGVDVASRELVISSGRGLDTIANTQAVIDTWLAALPVGSHIGLEATGSHHGLLADRAVLAGMVVYVLNPRDTKHYALGVGRRSKTDRVDAGLIRRLIVAEQAHLRPYQPATAAQHQLALLQRRRASTVKCRQALDKSLHQVALLATPLQQALSALDDLLASIDRHLHDILDTQEDLRLGAHRLETVPGIGRQTSTQLAVLFSRVPLTASDAAVAFVGLDPRACDSGQKQGRRRLSKRGPSELRRLLYNCAQAAARTPTWKPYYTQLKTGKFSTTQALVILARKLLRIAFSLWQQPHATFDAEKIACLKGLP
jgi:transposase